MLLGSGISKKEVPMENLRLPDGSLAKNPPAKAGYLDSMPGSGRSRGEGNGNLLQYSCLGNPLDRGAWQAVHGVTELDRT